MRRLPWSEDFQVLRNNNRCSDDNDEPQQARRTTLEGLVRIGGSGVQIEGRGRLAADPVVNSAFSNLRRRRAAAKVENNGLTSRNFELDAMRLVAERLCCPKKDVCTGEEGDMGIISDRSPAPSPASEKAKIALIIIPRPVCEIIMGPLELSCLQHRQPSLEARLEAVASAPSPAGGHGQSPLVANAAMKQYAWMHLRPLEPRCTREEDFCRCTVATCSEALEAPENPPAVQVLFNKSAGEEESGAPDGISSLDVENSKSIGEEDDGDSDWEYYDDEEEEERDENAAAKKSKPIMGGIPASLLTRWNWNYSTNEVSESEEGSEDEVDEMSPYNNYEVCPKHGF